MPTYGDLYPDIGGRNLGSALRRWKVWATDIDYTGALTSSGQGATQGLFQNAQADINSLDVESNTGTGGMLARLIIDNPVGNARVNASFRNLLALKLGSNDPLVSSVSPLHIMQPAGNAEDLIDAFDLGVDETGRKILSLLPTGEIRSRIGLAANTAKSVYLTDDANPTWSVLGSGEVRMGAGGATLPDIGFKRQNVGVLRITAGAGGSQGNLEANQITALVAAPTPPFIINSNARVPNLNADLLDGNDWGSPAALGGIAPNSGIFTTLQASGQITSTVGTGAPPFVIQSQTPVPNLTVKRVFSPLIDGGIVANSPGFKHLRVAISNIAAGAFVNVQANFATPFANANYTVMLSVFDSLGAIDGLEVMRQVGQQADHLNVLLKNFGVETRSGVLHVVCIHDEQ
jgi:hypothetical protein